MTVDPEALRAGDGWVQCRCGSRHWGNFGAGGLLIADQGRVLLQHRVPRGDVGDTWGFPGGARGLGESGIAAALRESNEEAGVPADAVELAATFRLDHQDWSYLSVVAHARWSFPAEVHTWESSEIRWVPLDQVDQLALHPAFGALWPSLRAALGRRYTLIVDGANVMGARPDGWWRDRRAGAERLAAALSGIARFGVPARWAPTGWDLPKQVQAVAIWPEVVLVTEGSANGIADRPQLRIEAAPASGDDRIVELVGEATEASQVIVATADRELAARARGAGAVIVGPGSLWRALDAPT